MKPTLLIVDDDRSVRESLKRLLEGEQYRVHAAEDAADAMELYHSRPIDLVILDINLGTEDGWALFERMAAVKPAVPAIAITAEWGQFERAVELGVEALMEKPIDVPVFLETVQDLLAAKGRRRIRGDESYCRYVSRHYEPYLRMLQKRYDTPFHINAMDARP